MAYIAGTGPGGFVDAARPGGTHVVEDVCVDLTEVTVAAYRRCVDRGDCTAPDRGEGCNWSLPGRDDHPVNCVDLVQATEYCAALGKRVPTEWEWAWAARGGEKARTYPWGEEPPNCGLAVMREGPEFGCGKQGTWQVGSKPRGNSRDGLRDMVGNVFEWTTDRDPLNPRRRVMRGGSFSENLETGLLGEDYVLGAGARVPVLGFRCVVGAGPAPTREARGPRGLRVEAFTIDADTTDLPDLSARAPDHVFDVPAVATPLAGAPPRLAAPVALRFTGSLEVVVAGEYLLCVDTDSDRAQVRVAGEWVLDQSPAEHPCELTPQAEAKPDAKRNTLHYDFCADKPNSDAPSPDEVIPRECGRVWLEPGRHSLVLRSLHLNNPLRVEATWGFAGGRAPTVIPTRYLALPDRPTSASPNQLR